MSCQWNGFANIGLVLASIWLIVLISMNRAFIVTNHGNLFTKEKTIVYIAAVWLKSVCTGIAPVLGWSKFYNQESRLVCIVMYRKLKSFSIMYHMLFEVIPSFIIGINTFIVLKLKRRHLMLIKTINATSRDIRLQQDSNETLMLLGVIFAFILCFLPDFILERSRSKETPSVILELMSTIFRMLNHAVNPIIYGIFNRTLRQVLRTSLPSCNRNLQPVFLSFLL